LLSHATCGAYSAAACRAALLDANNMLGVLWTNRAEPERALPFLREAQTVYSEDTPQGRDTVGGGTVSTTKTAKEEAGHTQTLFYLAQVGGGTS
jgi:hypothetical protein